MNRYSKYTILVGLSCISLAVYAMNPGLELIKAAKEGNLPKVQELIAKKVDVNTQDEYRRMTALMRASSNDHKDIVELLLKHGANVNAQNTDNETLLCLLLKKAIKI